MKTLKSSLLLISAFLLLTAFAPPKKYAYKSEEGKCAVTFPGEFTTDTEMGEDAKTVKTMCTFDGITFFASYSIHKVEITDQEEMAEVSCDSFKEAVSGQLLSKSEWNIDDHSGLMAVLDLSENQAKLEYRVILVGDIQYQLVAMAPYADYNDKLITKFFKSFKLLK